MGADWFFPKVVYGYAFTFYPEDLLKLYKQYKDTELGLYLHFLIDGVHNRMQSLTELEENVIIIVGFRPVNDLEQNISILKKMQEIMNKFTLELETESKYYVGFCYNGYMEDKIIQEEDEEEEEKDKKETKKEANNDDDDEDDDEEPEDDDDDDDDDKDDEDDKDEDDDEEEEEDEEEDDTDDD